MEDIPDGYQIYEARPTLHETVRYQSETQLFINSRNKKLVLKVSENPKQKKGLIQLVGVCNGKELILGNLPDKLSKRLLVDEWVSVIRPRLTQAYVEENNYVYLRYQLVGPKGRKKEFEATEDLLPISLRQEAYLKTFSLEKNGIEGALSARKAIDAHYKSLSKEQLLEWDSFEDILESFEDSEYRKDFGIRKVNEKLLIDTLCELKNNGKNYYDLADDQELVDALIAKRPSLVLKGKKD